MKKPSYVVHLARRAMACEFEICLNAGEYSGGTQAALDALDSVNRLEAEMSVFHPDSEIARINQLAAEQPVEVGPRLFAILELAMHLYRETDGAYDITSAPLWEAWGFARRAGAVPSTEELAEARRHVGGHLVELDPQARTVRFRRPGVRLNLGSIGKGCAVDGCGEILLAAGIEDFLVNGGNSSVLARGRRAAEGELPGGAGETPAPQAAAGGTPAPPQGCWTVGVADPLRFGRRLGEIRLRDRALGTSGSQFQSFRHQGRRYGHVLDPRTGWPAEGVLSATVLAPTAALADGLSTAFFVIGPEAALAYCHGHPEIAAVFVCPAGDGEEQMFSAGLSEGDWTRLEG